MTTFSNILNRILWFAATSDPEILEQCSKKEQTQHALTGTLVLITAAFALVTGTFAIVRLTGAENLGWGELGFGLLWSFLIFTFDRFLISTIQKTEPGTERKDGIWIVARVVLAIIIAFVITTPLKLELYKNQIADQKRQDLIQAIEDTETALDKRYKTTDLAKDKATFAFTRDSLNGFKDSVALYRKYKNDYDGCLAGGRNAVSNARRKRAANIAEINNIKNLRVKRYVNLNGLKPLDRKPDGTVSSYIQAAVVNQAGLNKIAQLERENRQHTSTISNGGANCNIYKNRLNAYLRNAPNRAKLESADLGALEAEISTYDTLFTETNTQLLNAERNKKKDLEKNLQTADKKNDGLLGEVDTLYRYTFDRNHPERWITFFLIFGIFILIEILPIFSKAYSKYGAYDRIVDRLDEENRITETTRILQIEEQGKYSKQWNKEIMELQMKVVKEAIKVWAKTEIEKLKGEMDKDVDDLNRN